MRNLRLFALLSLASLETFAACSSSRDDVEVAIQSTGPTIEARPNPCPNVRCADAMHCQARGKNASCVPDPACATDADCYLYAGLCSGAYACTCTAHENSIRTACTTPITCTHEPCAGYVAACVNGACAKTAVGTSTPCTNDADCRTFSSTCNSCSCLALTGWSPDPTCSGTTVQCTTDPCAGSTAVCVEGACTVTSSTQ